jgi:hypothetical protein
MPFFFKLFTLALRSNGSFSGVKQPGHDANNSPLANAEVRNVQSYTCTPSWHGEGQLLLFYTFVAHSQTKNVPNDMATYNEIHYYVLIPKLHPKLSLLNFYGCCHETVNLSPYKYLTWSYISHLLKK